MDTGNNRIVHFSYQDDTFNVVEVIDHYTDLNGKEVKLASPYDCYVTPEGDIYVADTANEAIVHMDKNYKAVKVITRPEDDNYTEKSFIPQKLVVDSSNRIFAQVQNLSLIHI